MVRATFAGFGTALSAIHMNQKKLDIVGQNLANMNTEGYTRQSLNTSSIHSDRPSNFYMSENDVSNVGYGVSMDEITQLRDTFLDKQYRSQNTKTNYNERIKDSLKSLSNYMDETDIDSIRAAFDDIQTSLTNMQDPSKVLDPVYEGELMSRMQALTSLFNSTSDSIGEAQINEFYKLDGTGTDENGAVQEINFILKDIGELNVKIKDNQLLGNPALELQDERNTLIDKLSGYVPIEVESFSEEYEVDGETRYKIYNYDKNGNVTGRSGYPEDLRIKLVWTEYSDSGETSENKTLTLVNGSVGGRTYDKDTGLPNNIGKVELALKVDESGDEGSDYPDGIKAENTLDTRLNFFQSSYIDPYSESDTRRSTDTIGDMDGNTMVGVTIDASKSRLSGGSVQASIDMLSRSGLYLSSASDSQSTNVSDFKASSQMNYYSYDYYMDRLNILARDYSGQMNEINKEGNTSLDGDEPTKDKYLLFVNKEASSDTITAGNIAISENWVNGNTHIGTYGIDVKGERSPQNQGNLTDTVLKMLKYMNTPTMKINNTKTNYTDYMNNVSTLLASDSYNNNNAYNLNNTVLSSINTSRDQLSGVSLDEEAANMMTYTTAYNAAAKLMTTLDEVLDTLIGIKR